MPSVLRKKKDQERRDRTRHQLLDASAAVFSRQGYHQSLVSDIVAEAGVGQGTFYRNFTNKRDVFDALLERFITELYVKFSGMTANLPTDVVQYRQSSIDAINSVAEILEKNRDLTLIFLRESSSIDNEFKGRLSAVYDNFASLAKFYLDHAISKGFARPCRSEVVAQSLVSIGVRMIELWFDNKFPSIGREQLIEEVIDFAFMGFAPLTNK
jgi:AcrR family transcriptional regulator